METITRIIDAMSPAERRLCWTEHGNICNGPKWLMDKARKKMKKHNEEAKKEWFSKNPLNEIYYNVMKDSLSNLIPESAKITKVIPFGSKGV